MQWFATRAGGFAAATRYRELQRSDPRFFASYLLTPARLRSHFELPEFAFRTAVRLGRRTESSSGNWIGPTAHIFSRRMQSGQRTTEKQQGSEKTQATEAEEPPARVAVRVNAGPGNRDGEEEIASGAVGRKA